MAATSRHLDARRRKGLAKLGDALVPGDGDLPRFSRSGCDEAVDSILDEMSPGDLGDLKGLLLAMALLPMFLVRAFVGLLELSPRIPGGVGSFLRFARLGVRGLVMSLYWSHEPTLETIGYEVGVYMGDREPAAVG